MKKIPNFLFFYKWTYAVQLKPEQGTRQFVFTSWQWQGIKVSATTRQILASKSLDNVFRDNATAKWNISRFFAPSSFGPLSCPLAGSQFMSVLVGGGGQLHPLTLCLLPHSTLISTKQYILSSKDEYDIEYQWRTFFVCNKKFVKLSAFLQNPIIVNTHLHRAQLHLALFRFHSSRSKLFFTIKLTNVTGQRVTSTNQISNYAKKLIIIYFNEFISKKFRGECWEPSADWSNYRNWNVWFGKRLGIVPPPPFTTNETWQTQIKMAFQRQNTYRYRTFCTKKIHFKLNFQS